jgi:hypothetical protein
MKRLEVDFKLIYQSVIVREAEQYLSEFEAKWGMIFIHRLPKHSGETGTTSSHFLTIHPRYDATIYATNAVESINMSLMKT